MGSASISLPSLNQNLNTSSERFVTWFFTSNYLYSLCYCKLTCVDDSKTETSLHSWWQSDSKGRSHSQNSYLKWKSFSFSTWQWELHSEISSYSFLFTLWSDIKPWSADVRRQLLLFLHLLFLLFWPNFLSQAFYCRFARVLYVKSLGYRKEQKLVLLLLLKTLAVGIRHNQARCVSSLCPGQDDVWDSFPTPD